jgi:tryptophan synthase
MADAIKKVFADRKAEVSSSCISCTTSATLMRTATLLVTTFRVNREYQISKVSISTYQHTHTPFLSSAFVTFLTAGYPTAESTVPSMLAMEKGGADVIELGIPFSDPIADGPAIQEANTVSLTSFRSQSLNGLLTLSSVPQVALANNITFVDCLNFVKEARSQGLKAPVMLMGQSRLHCLLHALQLIFSFIGYYNPLLSHGEEEAVREAKLAGANGFIVVDLPPEEAIRFRGVCTGEG